MNADRIGSELAGLRRLARSLADGDADDLLQDAALDALVHPPDDERPLRPWLAVVLRNRWRMTHRARVRRENREQAVVVRSDQIGPEEPAVERARALARLGEALVALDEPFRTTIIARYFDGESAADIARRTGVPAGTVRWRLKEGLDRLRAALDAPTLRAIAPLGVLVSTKSKLTGVVIAAILLLSATGLYFKYRAGEDKPSGLPAPQAELMGHTGNGVWRTPRPPPGAPSTPGQARALAGEGDVSGGIVRGRVINWSTGDGVDGADLVFAGKLGALTVRSTDGGAFELAPSAPGEYSLATVSKPGFLPYAPELGTSPIHLAMAKDRVVTGVTVFLYPALDYHGLVVDASGAPVAGALVRLVDSRGEQQLDRLETKWTSDAKGEFMFHAADDQILEATHGGKRGAAILDGNVAVSHHMTIKLGDDPPRDLAIAGRVTDTTGSPLPDVAVRATPDDRAPRASGPRPPGADSVRPTVFATTGPDGTFTISGCDRGDYELSAEVDDYAPASIKATGGTRDNVLVLDTGALLAGTVETTDHTAVPAFNLLVFRKQGAARELVTAKTIVDAAGRFSVHAMPGEYELIASAAGWAASAPVVARTGDTVKLELSPGAVLRGTIVSALDNKPLQYARVTREARGGGASLSPANAGTVTKADGTFELAGIPPGPVSITIGAGEFNPKIESIGMARDGDELGPVTIAMTPLAPGEEPHIELVGLGIALGADGDTLLVNRVFPGGGAKDCGIAEGDHIVSVEGASAAELGVDGAVARIRGPEGSPVTVGLVHDKEAVKNVTCVRKKLHT